MVKSTCTIVLTIKMFDFLLYFRLSKGITIEMVFKLAHLILPSMHDMLESTHVAGVHISQWGLKYLVGRGVSKGTCLCSN